MPSSDRLRGLNIDHITIDEAVDMPDPWTQEFGAAAAAALDPVSGLWIPLGQVSSIDLVPSVDGSPVGVSVGYTYPEYQQHAIESGLGISPVALNGTGSISATATFAMTDYGESWLNGILEEVAVSVFPGTPPLQTAANYRLPENTGALTMSDLMSAFNALSPVRLEPQAIEMHPARYSQLRGLIALGEDFPSDGTAYTFNGMKVRVDPTLGLDEIRFLSGDPLVDAANYALNTVATVKPSKWDLVPKGLRDRFGDHMFLFGYNKNLEFLIECLDLVPDLDVVILCLSIPDSQRVYVEFFGELHKRGITSLFRTTGARQGRHKVTLVDSVRTSFFNGRQRPDFIIVQEPMEGIS